MSYSFQVTIAAGELADRTLDDIITSRFNEICLAGQQSNGTAIEASAAICSIVRATELLLAGLGENWAEVGLTISGHANPGNLNTPGWANEFISVNAQVREYCPINDADVA